MLAQLVSVALTASVKATDTKSVSSFNHFLLENIVSVEIDLSCHPTTRMFKMRWEKKHGSFSLKSLKSFSSKQMALPGSI